MWESPVNLIETISDAVTKEFEDGVMLEITRQFGVSVDKKELTRALAYDREQYEKGYEDAKMKYKRPDGNWIKIPRHSIDGEHPSYDQFKCSECETIYGIQTNYCPMCGSRNLERRIKNEN